MNEKEWIRENQEAIWTYFLKGKKPSQKLIRNRFRSDENPTCGFYYTKSNWLMLHDFATGEHWNIIQYARQILNLGYQRTVDNLLNLKDKYPEDIKVVIEDRSVFDFIEKPLETNYFEGFRISRKTLEKYNVKSLRALYINESLVWRGTEANPVYLYTVNERFKAYKPLAKDKANKWKSNTKLDDVFGLEQLPEKGSILFVTSSLKDVMLLDELGFPSIAFPSEEFPIKGESSRKVADILKSLEPRFKHILFLLNNDSTGIRMSKKCKEKYGYDYIVLPEGPKDPSDYAKKYNVTKTKRTIKKLIKNEIRQDRIRSSIMVDNYTDSFLELASNFNSGKELAKIPED